MAGEQLDIEDWLIEQEKVKTSPRLYGKTAQESVKLYNTLWALCGQGKKVEVSNYNGALVLKTLDKD